MIGVTLFLVHDYLQTGEEHKVPLKRSTPAGDSSGEVSIAPLSRTTILSVVTAVFLSFIPVFLILLARRFTRGH